MFKENWCLFFSQRQRQRENTHRVFFFSSRFFFSAELTGTKSRELDEGHQSRRRRGKKKGKQQPQQHDASLCDPLGRTLCRPAHFATPSCWARGGKKKPSGDCSVSLQVTHSTSFGYFYFFFSLCSRLAASGREQQQRGIFFLLVPSGTIRFITARTATRVARSGFTSVAVGSVLVGSGLLSQLP